MSKRASVLVLVVAVAACGRSRRAAEDARFDLALIAPADATHVTAALVDVRPASSFVVTGGDSIDSLGDGDELPYLASSQRMMVRETGGRRYVCGMGGWNDADRAQARASCTHLRVEGDRLIVPFALLPADTMIGVGLVEARLRTGGKPMRFAYRPMTIGAHTFACGATTSDDDRAGPALALCASLRAP